MQTAAHTGPLSQNTNSVSLWQSCIDTLEEAHYLKQDFPHYTVLICLATETLIKTHILKQQPQSKTPAFEN